MRLYMAIILFVVYAAAASELTLIFWNDESLKTKKEKSYNEAAPPQENEVARYPYDYELPDEEKYCAWNGSTVVVMSAAQKAVVDSNEVAAADTALTSQADIDSMTQPLAAALLAIFYYFTNDLKLKITQDDFEAKIKEYLE